MHGRPGQARGSDRAVTVVGTTVDHAVVQGRAGVVRASLALVCAGREALERRAAMARPAVTTSASVSPSVVAGTQAGAAGGQGSSFAAPKRSLTTFVVRDGRCARSSKQRPSVASVEDSWIQLSTHARPIRYVGGPSESFSTAALRPRNIHRAEHMCVHGLPGSERRRCGQRSKGSPRPRSRPCRSTSASLLKAPSGSACNQA